MQRPLLQQLPPLSNVPSYEKLNDSITTRVLAARLNKQRVYQSSIAEKETSRSQSSKSQSYKSQLSEDRNGYRTPVKFLQGAALPNSIVKSMSQIVQPTVRVDSKTANKIKRDAYVQEIISRLKVNAAERMESLQEEEEDESEDSVMVATAILEKAKSETSIVTNRSSEQKDPVAVVSDERKIQEQTVKDRERVTRRTSVLSPLSDERRSTLESIQDAVNNSKGMKKLIDLNSMENESKQQKKATKRSASNFSSSSSLGAFYSTPPSGASLKSKSSRISKTSRRPETKTDKVGRQHGQKSILKSQRDFSESKPVRTVSILEGKMRNSETQTDLRMQDIDFTTQVLL